MPDQRVSPGAGRQLLTVGRQRWLQYAMRKDELSRHRTLIFALSSLIIVNAFLYFLSRDQTFVHIDAIAHVNKARGLFDNLTPGLRQLGSIWLPLPHLLIVPLTWFDALWTSGISGSLLSMACFIGTSVLLFLIGYTWTGSQFAGWMAFLCFAMNVVSERLIGTSGAWQCPATGEQCGGKRDERQKETRGS